MKVSLNWIKQFTEVAYDIDTLVDKIGTQLGAVEHVTDLGRIYRGIVVVKVVDCVSHPNADKLKICKVEDGQVTPGVERDSRGLIQVVCGAPNVKEGMLAAWLPPGTTVPSSLPKDPLRLEVREIRGQKSNGMLASAHELALSSDHDGIIEVDVLVEPGTSFTSAYELDDYIIDIENKMFTHRPDCFGILGVAREVAGIQNTAFSSPDWYRQPLGKAQPSSVKLELEVKNEIPELCPRFMAVALSNVNLKPSPLIIQSYLNRVGIRPVNNVVDLTNYLMVLTGQPLHAYDFDKVKSLSGGSAATLVVRKPLAGEQLELLNGKTIKLQGDIVVIATPTVPIGLGGVMGGANTEVSNITTNVILECANFNMYAIRKAAMAFGVSSEAVSRFNKGQSPLQNDRILEEAVTMLTSLSNANVSSQLIDIKEPLPGPKPIAVSSGFINSRLGLSLEAAEMAKRLQNVECQVDIEDSNLVVKPPFWRTDLEIPEDIVEEIGRLIGYGQLPLVLPLRGISPAHRNSELDFKHTIRRTLSRLGANELLTYSFVPKQMLENAGQDSSKAFQLANALSPNLQNYRLSLTPSLLEKIHPNIKAGHREFAVFELNKAHQKDLLDHDKLPIEQQNLGFVLAVDDKNATENYSGSPYYAVRHYLDELLIELGVHARYVSLSEDTSKQADEQWSKLFEPQRAAVIFAADRVIGLIGEYRRAVRNNFKLPNFCGGFELSITELQNVAKVRSYIPLSRYPNVEQDICLRVPVTLKYQELYDFLFQHLIQDKTVINQLEPIDIYQRKNDPHHKQITFRLTTGSYDKTLTDQEVNKRLDALAEAAKAQFGAVRI